jgi:hypothetical protein
MHDHSSRFVDDDEMAILVGDIQWNRLGKESWRLGVGYRNGYLLSSPQPVARLDGLAVNQPLISL